MKTVALFSTAFKAEHTQSIYDLCTILQSFDFHIAIYHDFYKQFDKNLQAKLSDLQSVSFYSEVSEISSCFAIFSLGGDGTFLKTAAFVGVSGIPIVGINLGRLGFLADTSITNVREFLNKLVLGDYKIEKRSVLQLSNPIAFNAHPFALNEIAVHKISAHSIITIHTWVDDQYLSTYWADGLIVSTPTGSTAYSLSIGGPIICPQTPTLILNPIAPHTLTVRPFVIPDSKTIKLRIESRENKYSVSLDSSSFEFSTNIELIIKKSDFMINIIKMNDFDYFDVLRQKLMWGADQRN